MSTKEATLKMKSEFSKEFGIEEERLDFLSALTNKAYLDNARVGDTVISLMNYLRDTYAKNVKEDMFICYYVGYIHSEILNKNQTIVINL